MDAASPGPARSEDTRLAPARYLELLRADVRRVGWLAEDGLDRPVPTCPGWVVRDVVAHLGKVYGRRTANLRTGGPAESPVPPAEEEALLPWLRASAAELAAELAARGPDAPTYTWWPGDRTVAFWYRRMAQETAVHRVDVEAAFDAMSPVDDALAVDGIDEVLDVFLTDAAEDLQGSGVLPAEPGIVAVRTGDHAWRVALDADGATVRRGPGSADATVTGEPSELLLWLWGRRPDQAVHVTGEPALPAVLRRLLAVATQ